MTCPDIWLKALLEQDAAYKFALASLIKEPPGSKKRALWETLTDCTFTMRYNSRNNFREQCKNDPDLWDGCGAWFEVRQ